MLAFATNWAPGLFAILSFVHLVLNTFLSFQQSDRSERSDRDLKRDQMEKLVREELERWDSEASMNRGDASPAGSRAATAKSSRGSPSRASQASAGSARMSVSTFPD